MPFTGPFAALRELVKGLEDAGGKVEDAAEEAKKGVFEEYQRGFAGERDPYGESWKPGKQGLVPVMFRDGALANPRVTMSKSVVRLKPERYGWIQQAWGREILPYRDGSLWEAPIQERIENLIVGYLESLGR